MRSRKSNPTKNMIMLSKKLCILLSIFGSVFFAKINALKQEIAYALKIEGIVYIENQSILTAYSQRYLWAS